MDENEIYLKEEDTRGIKVPDYGFEFVKRYMDSVPEEARVSLPRRKTKGSAGYDFESPETITIQPGETGKVKLGVKACFPEGFVLMLFVRSSTAIKKGLSLVNQVGIIDADFYNNPDNEGEMLAVFRNNLDTPYTINVGEPIIQGLLVPVGIIPEYDAKFETKERVGGIGSTDK